MLRSFTINIIIQNSDHNLLIGYISLLTKKNKNSNVHSRYKREYINYKFGSLANRLTQYKAHQMQDKKDYTVQVKKSTEIKKHTRLSYYFMKLPPRPRKETPLLPAAAATVAPRALSFFSGASTEDEKGRGPILFLFLTFF